MSKELFVSSTPHETKVAITEEDQLAEIYFERENEYTLAGSIYKGRVTRVLPGMQSAFVDIGLERDAFLYVTDFLLEEDEEVDVLDQGRPPRHSASRGEEHPAAMEAREVAVPAESSPEDDAESAETAEQGGSQQEPEGDGARKWRGRRRRRGGRNFSERAARPGACSGIAARAR